MAIFATAFRWITSHVRLFIEYVLLAMLVSVAGLCLTMWFRNTGLQESIAEMNGAMDDMQLAMAVREEAMTLQQETMNRLIAMRKIDSTFLQRLSDNLQTSEQTNRQWVMKYSELEDDHEVAKPFLDTPVPAGVKCLLDGTCQASSDNPN